MGPSCISRVKNLTHDNSRIRQIASSKATEDVDWYKSHLDDDIVPHPPTSANPQTGRNVRAPMTRHTSGGLASAMGITGENPPSELLSGARSNAELVRLHEQENRPHHSMPGVPIDLDDVERGLGMESGAIAPLSEGAVQSQIDEWRQINLDAEVQAMRTKMQMMARFSAKSLTGKVLRQQPKAVNAD